MPKPGDSPVERKEQAAVNSRQRVAVIGSRGQLGTDLVDVLRQSGDFDVVPFTHKAGDCTDVDAVRKIMLATCPEIVINCAAYVRVDDCEDHAREAFDVNAIGALNIARACAEIDALCVYISTDYVFDGAKVTPYIESDPTCPINVYGASKLAGEHLVRQAAPRWLIVRSASLFGRAGARGKGGNFVETILAKAKAGEPLRIVNDIRMSPTYSRDLAERLIGLLKSGYEGIIHVTNAGDCTWYEFATRALELTRSVACVKPVSSGMYLTKAHRPANSALQSERSLDRVRPWQDALHAYLIEKGLVTA
jgi:dTDP-4-dehydrorhamnose reductase